jgi:hypothetical protein
MKTKLKDWHERVVYNLRFFVAFRLAKMQFDKDGQNGTWHNNMHFWNLVLTNERNLSSVSLIKLISRFRG